MAPLASLVQLRLVLNPASRTKLVQDPEVISRCAADFPHLDETRIWQLIGVIGNRQDFLQVYLKPLPALFQATMGQLIQLQKQGSYDEFRQLLHTRKGDSQTANAPRFRSLFSEMLTYSEYCFANTFWHGLLHQEIDSFSAYLTWYCATYINEE